MTAQTRPYFEMGIGQLVDLAEDREEWPLIREELAFRKSRKAVKLAKLLGCMTKRRPSTREQVGQWDQDRVAVIPVTFPTEQSVEGVL